MDSDPLPATLAQAADQTHAGVDADAYIMLLEYAAFRFEEERRVLGAATPAAVLTDGGGQLGDEMPDGRIVVEDLHVFCRASFSLVAQAMKELATASVWLGMGQFACISRPHGVQWCGYRGPLRMLVHYDPDIDGQLVRFDVAGPVSRRLVPLSTRGQTTRAHE